MRYLLALSIILASFLMPSGVRRNNVRRRTVDGNLYAQPIERSFFTAQELERFAGERNLNGKLKVYLHASDRYLSQIRLEIRDHDKDPNIEPSTKAIVQIMEAASNEINNSTEKNKSRKLKKFEIALREELVALKNLQTKAPEPSRFLFTDPLETTEKLRREVLSLIFDEKALKKKK